MKHKTHASAHREDIANHNEGFLEGLCAAIDELRAQGDDAVSTGEDVLDDEEMHILLERAAAFCVNRFGFDPFDEWKKLQPQKVAP